MLQAEATISKVTTMNDRSLRLQVDTQELDPETATAIFSYYNKFGMFAFSEGKIDPKKVKVPAYAKIESNDKTPSKRLRDVMFIIWNQFIKPLKETNPEGYMIFDDFYRNKMEEIITHFKNKLDKNF